MKHGHCVTDETLTEYLEGRLDPAIKTASEVHLIECDRCRTELAYFMRMLAPEASPEEASAVEAVQQEWGNRRSSEKLSGHSQARRQWFMSVAAIAASLVAGAAAVNYLLQQDVPNSATDLVHALLTSEERPFEARISGQPFKPLARTRGAADAGVAYGPLAAEMTRLNAAGHDMGRFYLLQKDFGRALAYLEVAEQEVGAGPSVHNDLGVAYMEGGGAVQLERAAAEFRHALELSPGFAEAAFNMALYYERSGRAQEAEAQWRRFLQLDSNSLWTGEANIKLEGISR
jgi:tetratricopeptide (TPR) repeat protein